MTYDGLHQRHRGQGEAVRAGDGWPSKSPRQRRKDDLGWDQAKAYCRKAGIVEMGRCTPDVFHDGATLDEVIAAIKRAGLGADPGRRSSAASPSIARERTQLVRRR